MLLNLKNEYDKEKFKQYANRLYEKGALVEISEKKPLRSLAQNNYLHLIIGYFACRYGCDMDYAKFWFFKNIANPEIFVRERQNKAGKTVKYVRSSSDLTVDEMTVAITRFRNWSVQEADIYLPSANEEEALIYCRQEMDRNKEYI